MPGTIRWIGCIGIALCLLVLCGLILSFQATRNGAPLGDNVDLNPVLYAALAALSVLGIVLHTALLRAKAWALRCIQTIVAALAFITACQAFFLSPTWRGFALEAAICVLFIFLGWLVSRTNVLVYFDLHLKPQRPLSAPGWLLIVLGVQTLSSAFWPQPARFLDFGCRFGFQ